MMKENTHHLLYISYFIYSSISYTNSIYYIYHIHPAAIIISQIYILVLYYTTTLYNSILLVYK